MGPCSTKTIKEQPLNLDLIPYVTEGILGFNVRVSNIKLKIDNLPEGKVQMRISQFSTFETEVAKQLYSRIYFKAMHLCQIETTEQILRSSIVDIDIYNGDNIVISTIQLNLYQIATGPEHFDYEFNAIQDKKTISGKISFDFKMAQVVHIHIVPKFVEFNLNETQAKMVYHYSLKLVTEKFSFQSEFSEPYLGQGGQSKQILWLNNNNVVELTVEVPLIVISSSSIQICLWKEQKEQKEVQEIEMLHHHNYQLICETYVNLNQMFNQALNEEQITENQQRVYKILYKQNNRRLWNHGVNEGFLNFHLELTIPTYLQQQIVGVRTEKGVQQGSSVVSAGQMPVQEIKDLSNAGQKLFQICFKLQTQQQDFKTKLEQRNEQAILLRQITTILKQSEKQTITCFIYKSQQDLFNAQKIFIDFAFQFLNNADQQEELVREEFYNILKLIMNRGELALNQMGYSEETEQTNSKLLKFKTEVGISYQQFLYKSLDIVLDKLKQKSFADNERSFVEYIFASAYFKIPQFRDKIIASVQREDDPQLPEWRSLAVRPQDEFKEWKEFNDMFDWNRHFYQYLEKDPKYEINMQYLTQTINNLEWQKRLGKRGVAFFFFLKEWCDHVDQNVVVISNIPWQQLPGYNTLIKAFMLEMKQREFRNYPEAMKQALSSLLNNNNILPTVIVLLFNKTNLYDSDSLLLCLELLNASLQTILKKKLNMPTSLDQQFFLKGLRMILLQCEHAFCVAKCLWLIYNNYTLFTFDMRKDLCDLIFDHVAHKFFMHWSFNVRTIFHHLLLYRIFHIHKSTKEVNEEDLIEKYKEQVKPKKQHSFFDQKNSSRIIISDVIYMKFFRFMQQIEEGKKLSNQSVEEQMIEEKQFHQAMRAKLISRKINSKKKLDSNTENSSSYSSSYQIIQDDFEVVDKFSTKINLLEPVRAQRIQTPLIPINKIQLKYLLKAYIEFDELKFKYQKWKQASIPTNFMSLNEEEKANLNEQMVIPEVRLVVPQDEKENNIKKADEW